MFLKCFYGVIKKKKMKLRAGTHVTFVPCNHCSEKVRSLFDLPAMSPQLVLLESAFFVFDRMFSA